jgi:hypothetical protein
MKFFRSVTGYTLCDNKTNEETREELNICNLNELLWNMDGSGHNVYYKLKVCILPGYCMNTFHLAEEI